MCFYDVYKRLSRMRMKNWAGTGRPAGMKRRRKKSLAPFASWDMKCGQRRSRAFGKFVFNGVRVKTVSKRNPAFFASPLALVKMLNRLEDEDKKRSLCS